MSLWDGLIGQEDAAAVLRGAAAIPEAMTHAWLITGPPGSGRSVAARAFAAALQAPEDAEGTSPAARTAFAGTHADVRIHTTEKVLISMEEARSLIDEAHRAPAVGPWRIIIIEDADRIAERTSNVLLKSIEEPPQRTVWILCAPSAQDMLPTIRSRCRQVNLRIPPASAVADLLVRDGVEPALAMEAARASQSHIGVARHLATDAAAREYRSLVLSIPARLRSVADAVHLAGELDAAARERSKNATEERDAAERSQFLRDSGLEPGQAVPPALRAQVRALEEDQKRRGRRAILDTIDRALVDLLSYYRDVLIVQLGSGVDLVNTTREEEIRELAAAATPENSMRAMEAITRTRARLAEFTSIAPLLALEGLFISLRRVG